MHICLSLRQKHGHSTCCSSTTVTRNRLFSLFLKKTFFGACYCLFQSHEMIHCRTFPFLFPGALQQRTVFLSFFKTQHGILAGDSSVLDHYFVSISLCFLTSHDSIFETTGLWFLTLVRWCNALQSPAWYSPLFDNQPLVATFKLCFSSSYTQPEIISHRTVFPSFLMRWCQKPYWREGVWHLL